MSQVTEAQVRDILANGRRALVWFSATWCGPCKRMDRNALITAAGPLPFYIYHIADGDSITAACRIRTVPTFIVFEGGKAIARLSSSDTAAACAFIVQASA